MSTLGGGLQGGAAIVSRDRSLVDLGAGGQHQVDNLPVAYAAGDAKRVAVRVVAAGCMDVGPRVQEGPDNVCVAPHTGGLQGCLVVVACWWGINQGACVVFGCGGADDPVYFEQVAGSYGKLEPCLAVFVHIVRLEGGVRRQDSVSPS